MELLISNQQEDVSVSDELLHYCRDIVNKAWPLIDEIDGQISVVLVDNTVIRTLNDTYRNKDTVTDVLSFPLLDEEDATSGQALIGEIVISLPRALEQSEEYGHSLMRELAFLLVHGLLHLAGYDHDDENAGVMRQKEKDIMAALGISRD